MGYSANDNDVRVDLWRDTGKWAMTVAVRWDAPYENCGIHKAFAIALLEHAKGYDRDNALEGLTATCLEPYHEHSHPIMLKIDRAEWREQWPEMMAEVAGADGGKPPCPTS